MIESVSTNENYTQDIMYIYSQIVHQEYNMVAIQLQFISRQFIPDNP